MDQDGNPNEQPPAAPQHPQQPHQQPYPQDGVAGQYQYQGQYQGQGQFPGQPPSPQQWGYAYAEKSQAATALTLGLVGIVFCAIAAPFAWSIGNKEIEAIDAGRRDPSKRDLANAGKILGIIGTILFVVSIVFLVVFVIFFGFLGVVGSTNG